MGQMGPIASSHRSHLSHRSHSKTMILETIRSRAAADIQHIALPEGEDPRTLHAAEMCTRDGVAKITVLGDEEKVRSLASSEGVNLNGVEIIDHRKSADLGRLATLYYELRR